nr:MAG TPA: hypothetical protein [Bacteriophage sp.]
MKKAEVFPHLGFSFAYKKAPTGSDQGCKYSFVRSLCAKTATYQI